MKTSQELLEEAEREARKERQRQRKIAQEKYAKRQAFKKKYRWLGRVGFFLFMWVIAYIGIQYTAYAFSDYLPKHPIVFVSSTFVSVNNTIVWLLWLFSGIITLAVAVFTFFIAFFAFSEDF